MSMQAVEGERLVFLGGMHRSGTSLLHRCLSDHPDISGFHDTGVPEDEGQHLQSVYLPAAAYGGPGRFAYDPKAFLDEHSPLVTADNALQILREWARYWDMSRRLLLEKSPPNLVRSRFLQALFPGCRFVMVLRHPVAVAYATQKWTPGDLVGRLIEHWLLCHEAFERDRPLLQHVHVLRYEDFVKNPQTELDAIHRFLGVPSQPLQRQVEEDVNSRYLKKWRGRSSSWLTRPYVRHVVGKYEDRVRRFGYSLMIEDRVAG
jgi:hypothetical protein